MTHTPCEQSSLYMWVPQRDCVYIYTFSHDKHIFYEKQEDLYEDLYERLYLKEAHFYTMYIYHIIHTFIRESHFIREDEKHFAWARNYTPFHMRSIFYTRRWEALCWGPHYTPFHMRSTFYTGRWEALCSATWMTSVRPLHFIFFFF